MVEGYKIAVPDSAITSPMGKLTAATLPDELEDAGWEMGTSLSDMQCLIRTWKDVFDWCKSEAMLNELPNYRTQIDVDGHGALSIHFVQQRRSIATAIPFFFSHGWPGSFLETHKIEDQPAFYVVAPSLPNFGFSSGVKKLGFGLRQYAEICHKLMLRLGYSPYVTQGGD